MNSTTPQLLQSTIDRVCFRSVAGTEFGRLPAAAPSPYCSGTLRASFPAAVTDKHCAALLNLVQGPCQHRTFAPNQEHMRRAQETEP